MDFILFSHIMRDTMDRNLKSFNRSGHSAWQYHHVFAVFVFNQTAEASSGECMCERERVRESQGWMDQS